MIKITSDITCSKCWKKADAEFKSTEEAIAFLQDDMNFSTIGDAPVCIGCLKAYRVERNRILAEFEDKFLSR